MIVTLSKLSEIPYISHGFTLKKLDNGQDFNFNINQNIQPEENLKKLTQFIGNPACPVITCRQVHSNKIIRVNLIKSNPQEIREMEGDALITNQPNVIIAVLTADCLPILLLDKKQKSIGAIHAGRIGTMLSIVEEAIKQMKIHFGTRPENLIAGIGPGIKKCCYEVDKTTALFFKKNFPYSDRIIASHDRNSSKFTIDLFEANLQQLIGNGVPKKNITSLGQCSSCKNDLFFSYRADKNNTGRMLGFIMLRNK